jgi:hypothetical protein
LLTDPDDSKSDQKIHLQKAIPQEEKTYSSIGLVVESMEFALLA